MNYIAEYGVFLAKTITLVGGLAFILTIAISASQRLKSLEKQGRIEVISVNDRFEDVSNAMQAGIFPEPVFEAALKAAKNKQKEKKKLEKKLSLVDGRFKPSRPRIFVLDFHGDIRASDSKALAEKVTAVLMEASPGDEVVVRLESTGGMVHAYGLASSHLQRIKDQDIFLTVCVDKVAASGGYMMACVANKVLAAPFAVLGSIGVIAQLPNVHRLLKKHDIDFEMLSAGEYKRTLTVFGENTDKGRHKFQQEIEETHDLFKDFVLQHRPMIDINAVATGEVWFGQKALALNLIDGIQVSDDYLFRRRGEVDIFEIRWVEKHSIADRFGMAIESVIEKSLRSLSFFQAGKARFFH